MSKKKKEKNLPPDEVPSTLRTHASAELDEETTAELAVEDPPPEKAVAALDENEIQDGTPPHA
jgi:hypothetical protein